jgi:hypothetical protein
VELFFGTSECRQRLACDGPLWLCLLPANPYSRQTPWFLSENKNFQFAVGNEGFTGKQKDPPAWSAINASVRVPTL